MWLCIDTYTHAQTRKYTYTRVYTRAHAYTYTYTDVLTRTYTYTHLLTRAHTCTHAHSSKRLTDEKLRQKIDDVETCGISAQAFDQL